MNLYSAADYHTTKSMHTLSWIYAHGEAEDFMRHDVLLTPYPVIRPEPGLYSVTLHNPQGKAKQAFMFVWKYQVSDVRGLVVLGDDLESVDHCCSIFRKAFVTLFDTN
ncbi:hypothetical protein EBZ39_11760 [bacterium]|nr:hypothetical protein [bacterium]